MEDIRDRESILPRDCLSQLVALLEAEACCVEQYQVGECACSEPACKALCAEGELLHRRHYGALFSYLASQERPRL